MQKKTFDKRGIFRHVSFAYHFEDSSNVCYFLWTISEIKEFLLPNTKTGTLESGSVIKSVLMDTMQEMSLIYVSSKDLKKWNETFPLWESVQHLNFVGIHSNFKHGNKTVFVQDRTYLNLVDYISENRISRVNKEETPFLNTKKSVFDEHFVRKIASSVLNCLVYLHNQGIVYSNLSLDSIVITKNEHICLQQNFEMTRSKTKTNILYCSPELLNGEPYTTACDIWNFGIILSILLFGQYPFSYTSSEEDLQNDIKNKIIEAPLKCTLSKNCIEFVLALVSKDPKQRPPAITCLSHPWLNGELKVNEVEDSIDSEDEMRTQNRIKWESTLSSRIINTYKLLNENKKSTFIKSTFSPIDDILFGKDEDFFKRSPYSVYSNPNKNINPMTVLVVGGIDVGKRKFVEKLLGSVQDKISESYQKIYLNGNYLQIFSATTKEGEIKFIVIDLFSNSKISLLSTDDRNSSDTVIKKKINYFF